MRLKIGEFARVGTVSVSALRYYDEVGLLKPTEIDRWTGYRYYNIDQLPMLNRILALKDLGLSLEQIRRLLGEELPPEQIRTMLRLKHAELQEQAREIIERLARVETRIQQIEMEGKMSEYDVVLKRVGPMRVAILRDTVPNMDQVTSTFNRLFDEVLAYVYRHGAKENAAPFDIWYDTPDQQPENMQVAVAIPTGSDLPESDRVSVEELPGVEQMACVIHHGPFATLGQAYGSLFGWIGDNGYRVAGPNREIYLHYEREGDQNQYVTELQIPVART
ncbi:MAG: MerR family transcriptional regulator [Chloroflexota bacterium]|nr:MerR family transcriptional regulator [Chloroflexota bacterium]